MKLLSEERLKEIEAKYDRIGIRVAKQGAEQELILANVYTCD